MTGGRNQFARYSDRARRELVASIVLIALAGFVFVPMMFLMTPANASTNHIIDVYEYDYSPKFLPVAPGDTISWHNTGGLEHTATSNTSIWAEVFILPGNTSLPVTMPLTAGNYTYYCSFHFSSHPTMWGAIIVDTSIPEFSSSSIAVVGLLVIGLAVMLARRKR